MSSTTAEQRSAPTSTQSVRQVGDRVFARLAQSAGVLILVVLAGVAVFLVAEALPAITASSADLPGGQNLVAYIAPLVFGTVLAADLAVGR